MHQFRWLILPVFISNLSHAQEHHSNFHSSPKNTVRPLLVFSAMHTPAYQFSGQGWIDYKSPEGQVLFRAFIRKGKLDAGWTSWYHSGQVLDSGRLEMNLPDGEWKTWYPDGQLSTIRTFNAAAYRRIKEEFRLAHPRRSFYPLTVRYLQNPSKTLAQLEYTAAYPAGGGHRYASAQEQVSANATGLHSYQPVFAQCLMDGLYMNFRPDGMVKDSGTFKMGMRSGVWVHRSPDGETETGAYQDGARHREWKTFTASGSLSELVHYRNGIVVWRKKYP